MKFFNDFIVQNRFIDDLLDIIYRDLLIKQVLRLNDHQRTTGTEPVTSGGFDQRNDLSVPVGSGEHLLEFIHNLSAAGCLAPSATADNNQRCIRVKSGLKLFPEKFHTGRARDFCNLRV